MATGNFFGANPSTCNHRFSRLPRLFTLPLSIFNNGTERYESHPSWANVPHRYLQRDPFETPALIAREGRPLQEVLLPQLASGASISMRLNTSVPSFQALRESDNSSLRFAAAFIEGEEDFSTEAVKTRGLSLIDNNAALECQVLGGDEPESSRSYEAYLSCSVLYATATNPGENASARLSNRTPAFSVVASAAASRQIFEAMNAAAVAVINGQQSVVLADAQAKITLSCAAGNGTPRCQAAPRRIVER